MCAFACARVRVRVCACACTTSQALPTLHPYLRWLNYTSITLQPASPPFPCTGETLTALARHATLRPPLLLRQADGADYHSPPGKGVGSAPPPSMGQGTPLAHAPSDATPRYAPTLPPSRTPLADVTNTPNLSQEGLASTLVSGLCGCASQGSS